MLQAGALWLGVQQVQHGPFAAVSNVHGYYMTDPWVATGTTPPLMLLILSIQKACNPLLTHILCNTCTVLF